MRKTLPSGLMLAALVGVFGLFSAGCGPDFDPPSELHSLRVLAVQKDKPYAKPNETVNLQMLWDDASLNAGRPVEIQWSPACVDPPGDLYYSCFTSPNLFDGGEFTLTEGDSTSITLPKDIISRKPAPSDARNAPYGVAYVFFAACAGHLKLLTGQTDQTAFPFGCADDSGKLLGSDDFVAGYTSVYSFGAYGNANPVISGFQLNGKALPVTEFCQDNQPSVMGDASSCVPLAGSTLPTDIDCTKDDPRCIASCAADGDKSCPAVLLQPVLDKTDKANQEIDQVSQDLTGRADLEQMWINYYTENGSFKSPVRLLNDATAGWNDDYGATFYAPKEPGLIRVWSVAHDNRGGASWAGITLKVQ